jgi:3-dehydroquinate synthase
MSLDKKARGDRVRFVVLDGLAQPGILAGPAEDLLERAYAELAGSAPLRGDRLSDPPK